MTPNNIVSTALYLSHIRAAQVDTNRLWEFFNTVRKDLGLAIISDVGEDYFFQIWKRDAIANQTNGEYPYPEADSDSAGMLKLRQLAIKGLSTDLNYTPAREVKFNQLTRDWDWYLEHQAKNDPIYFIADDSIFVAPNFVDADLPASPSGNAQVKLYGIAKFTDLAAGATEASVLIPEDYHQLIAEGMKPYLLWSRGKTTEGDNAMNTYYAKKQDMIDKLSNRDESSMTAAVPDSTQLE